MLPRDVAVLAVGGITPDNMAEWRAHGADGFGLAPPYRAGKPAADVAVSARAYVEKAR